MVKNIIFDLGNVIINYNQQAIIDRFAKTDDEKEYLVENNIISAQEHIKKPDERIFKILLERYNLKAEECLFIDDDDTNRSYETANGLGILGRRVIPNDYNDIKRELEEFGVTI